MSESPLHIGTKLKPKHVAKYIDAAQSWLRPGEHFVALFWTNSLKPMMNAVVVTNARVAGISSADLQNPAKVFRNVVPLSDVVDVQFEKGRFSSGPKVYVVANNGQEYGFGEIKDDDVEAFRRHFESAAGATNEVAQAASFAVASAKGRKAEIEETYKRLLRGDQRLFGVLELRKLSDEIAGGETLVNLATGMLALDNDGGSRKVDLLSGNNGLVVLTDTRVIFFDRAVMKTRVHDFPFDRITSVQTEVGIMFGRLRINAMGSTAEVRQLDPKERATEIGGYVREALSAPRQVTTSQAAAPASDAFEQIKKLAELRDSGVVTAEEFAAKKAELLRRL